MATVLCSYSGLEFKVPYLSVHLTSRETAHPVFYLPPERLLKLTDRWMEQDFSDTESYLLYLAIFKATNLVEFRCAAQPAAGTLAVITQQLPAAANLLSRIMREGEERIKHVFLLPRFVVSPDTKDFTCSADWLSLWNDAISDYEDHYKTATALQRLTHQENILERYIKDATKDLASYAPKLANWAADAGDFPTWDAGLSKDILGGRNMSLRDYWKHIIVCCCKLEAIWDIPDSDILELSEHCTDNIHHGSIFAHTLMALLKAGLDRKRSFFNLGNVDISSDTLPFRILDASTSVEDANKLALIDSAPAKEPRESQYPNKLAYLKAKMNWRMKQEYIQGLDDMNSTSATATLHNALDEENQ